MIASYRGRTSSSQAVRSRLSHPVIDADGHQVNFDPGVEDYVRAIGGSQYAVQYVPRVHRRMEQADQERLQTRRAREVWWAYPTQNTLDRATVALPKLMYERLDELGLDYTVLFRSTIMARVYRIGSNAVAMAGGASAMTTGVSTQDAELLRVANRAYNAYRLDGVRPYADRMTAAADIPMTTPQQAIEEVEYAVKQLGAKVISIAPVQRPIKPVHERLPELASLEPRHGNLARWLDNFGIDSEYDYDPFWAKCQELKVAVMAHGHGMGYTSRNSPINHAFNSTGHFADQGEAMCKALFLGGVTRRLPTFKIAFLEGGVAHAARTYCDLFARWDKRGPDGIQLLNPANLDQALFRELHRRYGDQAIQARLDKVLTHSENVQPEDVTGLELNDFARCRITKREEIRELFVPHFYFGCEADDPMNTLAFNPRLLPYGAKLNAMFSSDVGHWDVPDITEVVHEAWEQVEHGLLTEENFKDLVFGHAVAFFTGANPDFFKGTGIEEAAAAAV